MRVVIATAGLRGHGPAEATAALARGWRQQAPHDEVLEYAVSDGGDGFLEVVAEHERAAGTDVVTTPVVVTGPMGHPVPASYVLGGPEPGRRSSGPSVGARTAYIEAGQAAGRHLVDPDRLADPEGLTSAGIGELMRHAREAGATRIVVGCADLASHDGGRGMALALAGEDDRNERDAAAILEQVREGWKDLDLVLAYADSLPLLGFHGASAALGSEHEVAAEVTQRLEEAMGQWSEQVARAIPAATDLLSGRSIRHDRQSGAGVGGGVGYLLMSLGARAIPGAQFVAQESGAASALPNAALVITGSEIYDWRAISDGVVAAIAAAAMEHAAPSVVLADQLLVGRREGMSLGIAGSYQRGEGESLEDLAARVARTWSPARR